MYFYFIQEAEPNIRLEMLAAGVNPNRLVTTDQVAWNSHTFVKSAADLVLDTVQKNK